MSDKTIYSLRISKSLLEAIKKLAMRFSIIENRSVSVTEVINDAVVKYAKENMRDFAVESNHSSRRRKCVCFQRLTTTDDFKTLCSELVVANNIERVAGLLESECFVCSTAALIALVKLANDNVNEAKEVVATVDKNKVRAAIGLGRYLFFDSFGSAIEMEFCGDEKAR